MCAIWKDLRYFSSWCPPSHLQSRTCAGSRLQNGKTVALGTSVQHYLSIAETTTQGYSVVQNPNHLQKYELCLLLAAGSCMKTILLKSDLSRVSNMSSSFCLFFYLAVLKKWSGLIPTVSTILEGRIRPWIIFLKGRDRRLHPTHPYGITVYGQELGIPERKASSTIQPAPVATRISYITFSKWKKKKNLICIVRYPFTKSFGCCQHIVKTCFCSLPLGMAVVPDPPLIPTGLLTTYSFFPVNLS